MDSDKFCAKHCIKYILYNIFYKGYCIKIAVLRLSNVAQIFIANIF